MPTKGWPFALQARALSFCPLSSASYHPLLQGRAFTPHGHPAPSPGLPPPLRLARIPLQTPGRCYPPILKTPSTPPTMSDVEMKGADAGAQKTKEPRSSACRDIERE